MSERLSLPERVYRALLWLYPRDFRERFGGELMGFVHERVTTRSGTPAIGGSAWARAFADLFVSAAGERLAQITAATRSRRSTPDSRNSLPPWRRQSMLSTIVQDARYAWRNMYTHPAFTAVIVLTLALGIGANTAIFSVVRGVLLRELPYRDATRIVHITHAAPMSLVSEPEFADYRNAHTLSRIAAYTQVRATILADVDPESVEIARVSDGFFDVLSPQMALGRWFTAEEDIQNAPPVAILSYGLWQRRFGGDLQVIGRRIQIDTITATIVGVAPAHFEYPSIDAQVWAPLRLNYATPWIRNNHYIRLIGRIAPGATIAAVQSELQSIATKSWEIYPDMYPRNVRPIAEVSALPDMVLGSTRPYLLVLLGAVGFVLLIACVNVANLLLARGEARRQELAVRLALGASRGRLIRQVLTESIMYSVAGMAIGLPLAWMGWRALRALAPGTIPRLDEVTLDGTVLLFTLVMGLATGVLFGLVPALRAASAAVGDTLKDGGRSGSNRRGVKRARGALVIAEVALAAMMLVGSGLMVHSLIRLQASDLGIHADRVLSTQVTLLSGKYDAGQRVVFFRELMRRTQALPGVMSAGVVGDLPIADGNSLWSILLDGQAMMSVADAPIAMPEQVTPGYFATMGIPLLKGRAFTDLDRDGAPFVAVVNEAMVQKYWKNVDPIGRTLKMRNDGAPWVTVVGVVGDVKHGGYRSEVPPAMYFPYDQAGQSAYVAPLSVSLVLRTNGDPGALAAPLRKLVHDLDPTAPLTRVETMREVVATSVASRRFSTQLLLLFAMLALVLAAIGIYGVISYSVSRRTFELGLRMALGAQAPAMVRLVVGEGMLLASAGLGVGLLAALALLQLAKSMLVEVGVGDPITFGTVIVLLLGVAALASYLPARRAMRLDPATALRGG